MTSVVAWMLKAFNWVKASKPVQYLIAVLSALLALKLWSRKQQKKGGEKERERQLHANEDLARGIHERVADAERLPIDPDDERGYRD